VKQTYTLITGASSGIGLELAHIAATHGRNLVLVARSEDRLTILANTLRKHNDIAVEVIALDLSQSNAPHQVFNELQKKHIIVTELINNAGFGDYGAFAETERQTQLSMIDLNIRTLTELTHLFLPDIIVSKGRIMNVSSVAGFVPGPMMSVYFATKAYVLSFSEALSEELRASGVTITCLAPGSTKTSFGETAQAKATHSTRTSRVTARQVAEFGWKAMQNGKSLAIHGPLNRVVLFLQRLLPRHTVAKFVHYMQR
jgi:short-subunit dehydrogenase